MVYSLVAMAIGGLARDVALGIWAVVGLVALVDLATSLAKRGDVSFEFPDEVFVGEDITLRLSCTAPLRGLTGRLDWPEGLSGPDEFQFTSNGETQEATVKCRAVRRGAWAFKAVWLRWKTRFGLFEFVPKISVDATLDVVPNIRLVQSGQITTTVMSTLFGIKENRSIGEGSEFHQLRDFAPGMDIKSIDWKRSAKRRSLVSKELRAERNHHVIVALDNGYLMREEIAGLPKIDHAITAALATAWAATLGGDLVGHYSYDVRPRSFAAPEQGRLAFARLRKWTAQLSYVGRETNHTLAMTELNARTPKRSLIIVFTDFVDTTSAEILIENVALLSKRHLVIFVTMRDPDLEKRVNTGPQTLNDAAELVSAAQMLRERRLVFERLARLGVTVIDARPGEVTAELITTYLDIKARELI